MKHNLRLATILSGLLVCGLVSVQTNAEIRINEFLASNDSGLLDESGNAVDWIELYNSGDASVNIGGYYLTDDPDNLTLWQFPSPTTMTANSYLIVFADSTTTAPVSGEELHANFNLGKSGEYLALVSSDGQTILQEFNPNFPEQYSDISYGITQDITEYISQDSTYSWSIPSETDSYATGSATGSIGFTETEGNGGFTVSYYHLNVSSISNTSQAETYISNQSYWKTDTTYPVVGTYDVIDFADSSSLGHYSVNNLFPTHTYSSENKNYFVVVAEADIVIPESGLWTFGSMSDDGFSYAITGNGVDFVCEYPNARAMSNTLDSFNFPTAGIYHSRLIYFEAAGGAGVELYAAQGSYTSFNSTNFKLVGDSDNGGIATLGAIESLINNDLSSEMKGVNSRIDLDYTFNLDELPSEKAALALDIRYGDGFLAYLNDTLIAEANAPETIAWNSTALSARTTTQMLTWETFQAPLNLLKEGENNLKIVALNDTTDDAEFFIQPVLSCTDNSKIIYRYFTNPSPENSNGDGLLAKTASVEFSQPRGYCDTSFTLTLSCADTNAQIYYTLDGNTPSETAGTLYTQPLTISKTTVLRAIAYVPDHIVSDTTSRTWIFLSDVYTQSSSTPSGWPASYAINSHKMYYGMNSSVTQSTLYKDRLTEGFKDINTISLITDLDNLFNIQTGIYVNPGNSGDTWERPVSVEMIDPNGGDEFQINAGLRIRGAASRSSDNPKHSFRLFFRSKYGKSTLKFPLFGTEGTDEFDKVDLRTEQNHSWHREAPSTYTAIREVFSRDGQRDAGTEYTRSRYYHLFLNGLYWGLYMTEERVDADYAVSYMGGEKEDWDCVKTESSSGRTTVAGDGNLDAWENFYNYTMQGYTGSYSNNYYTVRGLNPDGTRNTNYPVLLDQDNLIKFMVNAYYAGDPDNPYSLFGNFPNNLFALYNRNNPDGFKWFRHDAEHSLAANGGSGSWGLNMDYTSAGWGRTAYSQFEPIMMHLALVQHPEYKMRFADIVQEQFFNGGIFTPESCIERYKARMATIDRAVIGESARWGATLGTLRTRDSDWVDENDYLIDTYFPQRTAIVLKQFKNQGWYPSISAPTSSNTSGQCVAGEEITLNSTGTFYYTTDGSDPRLAGGGINPSAVLVVATNSSEGSTFVPQTLITKGDTWKYYDVGATPTNINNLHWRAINYNDTTWSEGAGVLGFGSRTVATTTTRITSDSTFVTTTYFRKKFSITDTNDITGLKLTINRDDGAIVYLNGTEILRDNMPTGTVTFDTFSAATVSSTESSTYFEYSVSADQLRLGNNVISVEVHQCNGISSDMYFDMELVTEGYEESDTSNVSTTLTIDQNTTLLVRTYINGVWSALSTFNYIIQQNFDALRISELMYSPTLFEGDTGDYHDYAWLEICNTGTETIDMESVQFTQGIEYTFPSISIGPDQYLVLAKNAITFATRYDTNNMLLLDGYTGNLARKGETITLQAPDGTEIQSFTYDRTWYKDETDRTGYSLEIIDVTAPTSSWNQLYNWYPSILLGGTPGYAATLLPGAEDQVVALGDSATISLAESVQELPHQWFHATIDGQWELLESIAGTLTIPSVTEADAGYYMAKLEKDGTNYITTPTELMILLGQPQDLSLTVGKAGALELNIVAATPDKLQWQMYTSANQWEDVINGTGSTLTIEKAVIADAGQYRVRLNDQWVSDTITLIVWGTTDTETPVIITQPQSITCFEGEDATFEIQVQSNSKPNYKWQINGVFDSTATNSVYTIQGVTSEDNGKELCCYVFNTKGTRISSFAYLTVEAAPEEVQILTQPQSATIHEGETITLSVTATGQEPLSYQWYFNDTETSSNENTLTVSEAGTYKVNVSNAISSVMSDEAIITITVDPQIPPILIISRGTSDQLIIQFEGSLQMTTSLENPEWVTVDTVSPAQIKPDGQKKYFRAVW